MSNGLRIVGRKLLQKSKLEYAPFRSVCFEGWFIGAFNKVDQARIKEVGVDRAAAEWLLRCGAGVRWTGSKKFLHDYNTLLTTNMRLQIAEIDATEAAIMEEA